MRLIGSILLCAAVNTLSAEPPEQSQSDVPSVKLSLRLASEIRASLPKYQPPAEKSESESPTGPTDSEILVLPKIVVKQTAPTRIIDDDLLTEKSLNKRLVHEYKNSLEGLDAILNGFSIPLVGPSLKARARGAYKQRKLDGLNTFVKTTSGVDNKSGAEMKKAVDDLIRADDWQHRLVK